MPNLRQSSDSVWSRYGGGEGGIDFGGVGGKERNREDVVEEMEDEELVEANDLDEDISEDIGGSGGRGLEERRVVVDAEKLGRDRAVDDFRMVWPCSPRYL